ncbi:unnamed protein product [Protopolystoma xenopodis]|uniref:Protein kinase domain-containing protein n=1 Tax=Protopolystoma xenopodis TaxID=117903 RepID=A0A3S5AZE7_9PLAT|nr:unnamed protein product [Protopolystoma xenopodis]
MDFLMFSKIAVHISNLLRCPSDFQFVAPIGRGAYGRVSVVREKSSGRVCAMKMLPKQRLLTQHADCWAEREVMACADSPWLVRLFYAFQIHSDTLTWSYVPTSIWAWDLNKHWDHV